MGSGKRSEGRGNGAEGSGKGFVGGGKGMSMCEVGTGLRKRESLWEVKKKEFVGSGKRSE